MSEGEITLVTMSKGEITELSFPWFGLGLGWAYISQRQRTYLVCVKPPHSNADTQTHKTDLCWLGTGAA